MIVKRQELGRAAHFLERVVSNLRVQGYRDLGRVCGSYDPQNSWGISDLVRFSDIEENGGVIVRNIGYHFSRYGRDIITARVMPDGGDCSLRVVCLSEWLKDYDLYEGKHDETDNNVFVKTFPSTGRLIGRNSSFNAMMRAIVDLHMRHCPIIAE